MFRFIITGLIAFACLSVKIQAQSGGYLLVRQDPVVDTLLCDYELLRQAIMDHPDHKYIPGYRIQIFFDSGLNSSDRARQTQEAFMLLYPDYKAYVSWKAPNYRVRVGDFKTRIEAEKVLQLIIIDYPNAWVTRDEINFPVIN